MMSDGLIQLNKKLKIAQEARDSAKPGSGFYKEMVKRVKGLEADIHEARIKRKP
jgi:hypothetical protein